MTKYEQSLKEEYERLDEICFVNQSKVIEAMQENSLSERHFSQTTGYGYNDDGRDACERIFADVFGAEAGIVRPQIVSGTHAISLALTGVLRPNDEMLSITGTPYDTILSTIGVNNQDQDMGSLIDFGVVYKEVDFNSDGDIDFDKVRENITPKTKVVYMQRSTGYSRRKALTINDFKEAILKIRAMKKDVVVIVDNCYGEFLDTLEPTNVDADLIAGSLIKNPGGGLAPTGGYIIGKQKYIDKVAARQSAPGIAYEVGSNFGLVRTYLQGLFMAPKVTNGAIKGAILTSKLFEDMGYDVFPRYNDNRSDIIQAVVLNSYEKVCAYCKGIQMASPVDSFAVPLPWDMPGYDSQVIMAAGNFIQGSSIELSADAPMREPYTVYQQGGLTYEHSKIGIMYALNEVNKIK